MPDTRTRSWRNQVNESRQLVRTGGFQDCGLHVNAQIHGACPEVYRLALHLHAEGLLRLHGPRVSDPGRDAIDRLLRGFQAVGETGVNGVLPEIECGLRVDHLLLRYGAKLRDRAGELLVAPAS